MGPEGIRDCLQKYLNTGKQKYNNMLFEFILSIQLLKTCKVVVVQNMALQIIALCWIISIFRRFGTTYYLVLLLNEVERNSQTM
jgi:hypothetical protein